jgi:outer membrane protein TolC
MGHSSAFRNSSDPHTRRRRLARSASGCLGLLVAVSATALAQSTPTSGSTGATLTIAQAVQYALDHYPTVRAAVSQIEASSASVDVARATSLPRLDGVWQSNRATANNVFGQLLPQSVMPSLTGPVLSSASSDSVWGSATGALLSWEPMDFGLRRAGIASAEAGLTRARAFETLTRLDVQQAVANACLNVIAAERAVSAAQADVDRRQVLGRAVQTLVDNQLRPGAEASRANAERAAAQTRLIRAQQNVTLAQTTLMRVLGMTAGPPTLAADSLPSLPGDVASAPSAPASHPLAQAHRAAIDQAKAAEEVLARTDYPRVYVQSSVFARGSGADPSGVLDGGLGGLGLDRANWAAGVQVVFPNVFDFTSLRARKTAAAASTRSESLLYDEAVLTVTSEQRAAAATLAATRAIAASTPVQLAAAQESEQQARARFDAGLASIVEVADAQNLLAQAEVDDQLARVDLWRALLAMAVAQGDLAPFLNLVAQP